MSRRVVTVYLLIITSLLTLVLIWYSISFTSTRSNQAVFNGQRALEDVHTQVGFGSRWSGSNGNALVRNWIRSELINASWDVIDQQAERLDHPVQNIIANRTDDPPAIILGAHYDTRKYADKDPLLENRTKPVPGANDGASGVAVLLELARTMPEDTRPVWLVFFDAEDNGRIEGWDWILGSRLFVRELELKPQSVIVVDMVGDADLGIYYEINSDERLRSEIWDIAEGLGYGDLFIKQEKYSMLDDHTPFLEAGIAAVDIIDFDYPYWHTVQDTPDKISANSLQAVGTTLLTWLSRQK